MSEHSIKNTSIFVSVLPLYTKFHMCDYKYSPTIMQTRTCTVWPRIKLPKVGSTVHCGFFIGERSVSCYCITGADTVCLYCMFTWDNLIIAERVFNNEHYFHSSRNEWQRGPSGKIINDSLQQHLINNFQQSALCCCWWKVQGEWICFNAVQRS